MNISINERVATLENENRNMKQALTKVEEAIQSLQKTVWYATGAFGVLVIIIEIIANAIHK